jgi:hypothetical protein
LENQFDVTLEDAALLSEVELTTNLIVAVSEFERFTAPVAHPHAQTQAPDVHRWIGA